MDRKELLLYRLDKIALSLQKTGIFTYFKVDPFVKAEITDLAKKIINSRSVIEEK